MKKVSILIPAYKPEHFRECLTSALAQTWLNKEIIVSDDRRDDQIKQICAEYGAFVRYVRNPNPGVIGHNNIRHLCNIADGYYIKFLFDDDILSPFCVQYLVDGLEAGASSDVMLAFSPRLTIDRENRVINRIDHFAERREVILPGEDIIRKMAIELINPIGEFTTVLFRRKDIFDKRGELQIMEVDGVHWRGLSDVALFIDLCSRGPAVQVKDILSYFRLHPNSNSNSNINPEWAYAVTDWKLVVDYAISHRLLTQNEILKAYKRLARLLRKYRDQEPALAAAFDATLAEVRRDFDTRAFSGWTRLLLKPLLSI